MTNSQSQSVESQLQSVANALSSSDWSSAVEVLLSAWRFKKSERLSNLLDDLDNKIVIKQLEPVTTSGAKNRADAWELRDILNQTIDIPILIDYIKNEIRITPAMMELTISLALSRPTDPRIAAELYRFLIEPPYQSNVGNKFYPHLLDGLEIINAPHINKKIIQLATEYEGKVRVIRGLGKINMPQFHEVAKKLSSNQVDIPLTEAELQLCDQVAELINQNADNSKLDEQLIETVYQNPLDLSARLVYSDSLMQKNDPRGEFIALQCAKQAGKQTRREKVLFNKYKTHWIGKIEPYLSRTDIVFENGFLSACKLDSLYGEPLNSIVGLQEWSTVKEIDLCNVYGSLTDFLLHPVMKSLERIYSVGDDLEKILKHDKILPWTHISSYHFDYVIEHIAGDLEKNISLRNLTSVELRPYKLEELFMFLGSELGRRIQVLHLSNDSINYSSLIEQFIRRGFRVDVIEYMEQQQNGAYSNILKIHRGWLISIIGVGKYDKLVARYGKDTYQRGTITHSISNLTRSITGKRKQKSKPDIVKELFKSTNTIHWSRFNELEIHTPITISDNEKQNIVKGTQEKYNKNLKVIFKLIKK